MTKVYVFPGQGSQKVGMGREIYDAFPEARRIFEEVDDTLDQHLSKLIFEGPESDLNLTVNTQPALMVVSLAIFKII
jgi:[acyl-carrier-protein] S-malonyltransferase